MIGEKMKSLEELLINSKKLKFPHEMEKQYITAYNQLTAQYAVWYIPVGIVFVISLMLFDLASFPAVEQRKMVAIRFISLVILVFVYILNFSGKFQAFSQLYISIILLSIDIGLKWIMMISEPDDISFNYYFIGVFLLIAVTYCMVRIRFVAANILALFYILSYAFVAVFYQFPVASEEQILIIKLIIFMLGAFSLLCTTTCYFLEYFSRRDFIFQKIIEEERRASEELLLNILPVHVVNRLKSGDTVIADSHEHVTILFADLVGFTKISRVLPASELVMILNTIFTAFDELSEKYDVEKIKTIGDSYMVSSKVGSDSRESAEKIVHLAEDMIKVISSLKEQAKLPLHIRIGIHTGPVVAGVIGKNKFAYDMWGDTVNTASRMESTGINGKVQVSEATFTILKDKFDFIERGKINVKGLGMVRVYLL